MKPVNPYFQNPNSMNRTPAYDVSKLISNYQAQKDAPGLMPIGQFSPEQMQSLSPERRTALEQRMGAQVLTQPMPQQLPRAVQRQLAGGQQPPQRLPRAERKARRLTGLGNYRGSNSQYMGGSPNFNEQTGAYIS